MELGPPLKPLAELSLHNLFCFILAALLGLLRCYCVFGPKRLRGFIPSDSGHQTLIVSNEETKALSAQVVAAEQRVTQQRCQWHKSVGHRLPSFTYCMCVYV